MLDVALKKLKLTNYFMIKMFSLITKKVSKGPISTSSPCPRHSTALCRSTVFVILLSLPILHFTGIVCGPQWGLFALQFGDYLWSGIICGLRIICGAVHAGRPIRTAEHRGTQERNCHTAYLQDKKQLN